MDALGYAMQMEKDGEGYYRELAGQVGNKGLANILTMLANEEVKHQQVIEQMKSSIPPGGAETTILGDAKNIFAEMREEGSGFAFEAEQIEVYRKAGEIEKASRDFYLEQAAGGGDEAQKGVFLALAEEEKKHLFLLENIIEFVSRPTTWLENAEFNHLEEY